MLTDKQGVFCREYLVDLNATLGTIRMVGGVKYANRIAAQLLAKPKAQKSISEQHDLRTEINADYDLRRLAEIDQMDVMHMA